MLTENIKIGHVNFSIKETENFDHSAQIVYETAVITLKAGLQQDFLASSDWHEVCHAITSQAGISKMIPEELEESLMECLGNGIVQVLRDNPMIRNL